MVKCYLTLIITGILLMVTDSTTPVKTIDENFNLNTTNKLIKHIRHIDLLKEKRNSNNNNEKIIATTILYPNITTRNYVEKTRNNQNLYVNLIGKRIQRNTTLYNKNNNIQKQNIYDILKTNITKIIKNLGNTIKNNNITNNSLKFDNNRTRSEIFDNNRTTNVKFDNNRTRSVKFKSNINGTYKWAFKYNDTFIVNNKTIPSILRTLRNVNNNYKVNNRRQRAEERDRNRHSKRVTATKPVNYLLPPLNKDYTELIRNYPELIRNYPELIKNYNPEYNDEKLIIQQSGDYTISNSENKDYESNNNNNNNNINNNNYNNNYNINNNNENQNNLKYSEEHNEQQRSRQRQQRRKKVKQINKNVIPNYLKPPIITLTTADAIFYSSPKYTTTLKLQEIPTTTIVPVTTKPLSNLNLQQLPNYDNEHEKIESIINVTTPNWLILSPNHSSNKNDFINISPTWISSPDYLSSQNELTSQDYNNITNIPNKLTSPIWTTKTISTTTSNWLISDYTSPNWTTPNWLTSEYTSPNLTTPNWLTSEYIISPNWTTTPNWITSPEYSTTNLNTIYPNNNETKSDIMTESILNNNNFGLKNLSLYYFSINNNKNNNNYYLPEPSNLYYNSTTIVPTFENKFTLPKELYNSEVPIHEINYMVTTELYNNNNNNKYSEINNLLSTDVEKAGMKIYKLSNIINEGLKESSSDVNKNNETVWTQISSNKDLKLTAAESAYFKKPISLFNKPTHQYLTQNQQLQQTSFVDNRQVIPGAAGEDYPTLSKPPLNSRYSCKGDGRRYIADISTGCQVFFMCVGDGPGEPMLCPNGTLFSQDFLVCDWWYNVDCH